MEEASLALLLLQVDGRLVQKTKADVFSEGTPANILQITYRKLVPNSHEVVDKLVDERHFSSDEGSVNSGEDKKGWKKVEKLRENVDWFLAATLKKISPKQ